MDKNCCANCVYWIGAGLPIGTCIRFPPRPLQGFPSTDTATVCGEHSLKEVAQKEAPPPKVQPPPSKKGRWS